MKPLKNQNRTQNPPTCQNYPTMMAKNLRFSKKYSKSTYKVGNKGAKFVTLSQKSNIQNVGSNWGKNLRKSNILGYSQKNSKIQYYGALEKIKIKPEIRQRIKITPQ